MYVNTFLSSRQIGNLAYYHFFRVVSEAGLLPHAHEDIEDWRDRMRRSDFNSLNIRGFCLCLIDA